MSGVKNLRAMFEQKGDASPPSADDRGRSPGAGSTGTESPRPISRIRTSFIAIEKDGRLGLQRDNSRDSSVSGVSTRKLSGDLETPSLSRTTSQDNTSAPAETRADRTPMRTSLKEQTIPESPRSDSVPQLPSLPLPKSPHGKALAPPMNPDKAVDEEEVDTTMAPVGGPTDKSAVTGNSPAPSRQETSAGTSKGKEKENGKGKAAVKEPSKPVASTAKPAGKPVAPVNTASKTAAKPTKSPTVAKPLKSPATSAPKLASKAPEKKAAHPEKTTAPKTGTSTATTKPAATSTSGASSSKKPPPLHPTPASTGFVKPKVKSPTRPVKLPPGLTTHTAASATKFNVLHETRESRQSLPAAATQDTERHGRSHSRASISTTGTRTATTTAGKDLKQQGSTANRSRPSIGPPPKQPSKEHAPPKKEAHVDESFLARMMRPTAASASKTHEKPPVTPPRKTSTAAPVKKTVPKPEAKHAEAKHAEAKHPEAKRLLTQHAQTKHPLTKHPLPKQHDAKQPETKQQETKQQETKDVKPAPKTAEPAVSSLSPAEQSSPAKKIAPMVEKVATAEEAIAAAKKMDGPVQLPEATKPEEKEPVPQVKEEEAKSEDKKEETKPNEEKEQAKPEEKGEQAKSEEKKEEPAPAEVAAPVEKFEGTAAAIEAGKQAEDEAAAPAEPEPEAPRHEMPPEQDDEAEAAEEAPSEATLVNPSSDKAGLSEETEPEAEPEVVKAGGGDEGKIAEDLLSKEEVAA